MRTAPSSPAEARCHQGIRREILADELAIGMVDNPALAVNEVGIPVLYRLQFEDVTVKGAHAGGAHPEHPRQEPQELALLAHDGHGDHDHRLPTWAVVNDIGEYGIRGSRALQAQHLPVVTAVRPILADCIQALWFGIDDGAIGIQQQDTGVKKPQAPLGGDETYASGNWILSDDIRGAGLGSEAIGVFLQLRSKAVGLEQGQLPIPFEDQILGDGLIGNINDNGYSQQQDDRRNERPGNDLGP